MATSPQTGLTIQQERFAEFLAKGYTQRRAYQLAGYGAESQALATIDAAASRLAKDIKVKEYIAYLRALDSHSTVLSRQRKRELLSQIAETSDQDLARLGAIKVDNQMTGDDAPIKVQGEITLGSILQGLRPTTGLPSLSEGDVVEIESP